MEKKIMLIAGKTSFFVSSIQSFLKNASYKVDMVPADTDAINAVKEGTSGILICVDEFLFEAVYALQFIKDMVLTYEIPVFAAGTKEELKALEEKITKELISIEIVKPLKAPMSETIDKIDHFIRQYYASNKKKILVVDDSGAMLRNVKGWLEKKYDVHLANSGAMAIKFLVVNRPDLVLLDYEMPVVDGKQVLEMIRTEPDFNTIPVMFLTNKTDNEHFMNVVELKPEGYLLKTTEPAMIVKAIDDYFDMQKALK